MKEKEKRCQGRDRGLKGKRDYYLMIPEKFVCVRACVRACVRVCVCVGVGCWVLKGSVSGWGLC